VNDTQILTLAISIIVPVSFLLLSNSRISDVKETLRAEIETSRTELRSETQVIKNEMQASKIEILTRLDRFEDNITRLLADHEHRITKLETGRI
jgi:hypothetical protein